MIAIDGILLFSTSYLIVHSHFKIITSFLERIALAFAIGLGIKTLILFLLFLSHLPAPPYYQISINAVLLIFSLNSFRKKRKQRKIDLNGNVEIQKCRTKDLIFLVFVTLTLLAISLLFSIYFPVTETDGVVHSLKGKMYFAENDLDPSITYNIFAQYTPFIPLLTTYLVSYNIQIYKIFFPFYYLFLIVLFYYRLKKFSNNSRLTTVFTFVLCTTPYIWWHSYLMFLNLASGFYFAVATLYWFFLIKYVSDYKNYDNKVLNSYALLSGIFYGFALWVRLEFLIYYFIPFSITICLIKELPLNLKRSLFLLFTIPVLIISSIWNIFTIIHFSNQTGFNYEIVFANILLFVIFIFYLMDFLKINQKLFPYYLTVFSLIFLVIYYKYNLTIPIILNKLETSIARTIVHNYFFSATSLLFLLLIFTKLNSLDKVNIYFGVFLLFYLILHTLLYCYGPSKWQSGIEYFKISLFQPGLFINASGTREMIAFYPVFVFFIATLPNVRKAFSENQ